MLESCTLVRRPGPSTGRRQRKADAKTRGRNPPAAWRGGGHRSALHPVHLGHDRACPKGVVRDNGGHHGRAEVVDVQPLRHQAGRGVVVRRRMSAGWWATPTSPMAPLLHGATTVLYEGKPVGTPDAGAFWRVISRAYGRRGAVHGADRLPRDQEGRSRKATLIKQIRPQSKFRTLFLAGERADPPKRWSGPKQQLARCR
jgi:propionyl-CoA synthetase